MPTPPSPPRIAILGGGVTGLAAALRLARAPGPIDWRLFEAAPRLGGVLQTERRDGYLVERSADNFLTREPWAERLCQQVGIANDLLPTDPSRRRALVVSRGRVVRVPQGFVLMSPQAAWPILASPVLSVAGKLRLAREPFVPRRDPLLGDESVASFARRRLGRETYERLVQPLVGGIYTADPERLSLAATFPQFAEQEARLGGLLRAALFARKPRERRESGARYGQFVAPREGMEQIITAAAGELPPERIRPSTPVSSCRRSNGVWRLGSDDGPLGEFDGLIVALPAPAAAKVLRAEAPQLADELAGIEYAGASVVVLGVREDQVARPIDGFGFVVPKVERRRVLAASFASHKFPGRAPEGRVLIRVFVGGALQPELADRDDAALIELARQELAELIGLSGDPELSLVARWPQSMPQYHVGHLERVARIEQLADAAPGLQLAGAAYRGVGVPQCVHSGQSAAERLLEQLAASRSDQS